MRHDAGSPTFTFVRCLILVVGLSPTTGCYSYTQTSSPVPARASVRATPASEPQILTLAAGPDSVPVPGILELRGTVLASTDQDLRVRVQSFRTVGGTANTVQTNATPPRAIRLQSEETVATIPFTSATNPMATFKISQRRFSAGRTALLIGGVIGALTAVAALAVSDMAPSY
jgi:hypothetical protein